MKKFSKAINGYDIIEVNKFVNDVTFEYENLLTKLKITQAENENLKKTIEKFDNIERVIENALKSSKDTHHIKNEEAEEKALEIISNAKKNASQIVNEALIRANKLEECIDNLKEKNKEE